MTHEPVLTTITAHDNIIKENPHSTTPSGQKKSSDSTKPLSVTPDPQHEVDISIKDEPSLRDAILKQLEYYFSRKNLSQDAFLVSQMNAELFVPISVVASFAKIQALTTDEHLLLDVMKSSNQLIVDEPNMRVRPNFKIQRNTLILRDIPSDADPNTVAALFKGQGNSPVRSIRPEIGNTWFVSFDTESEAIDMLMYIRGKTWDDRPIPCRLKSENLLKSIRDGELGMSVLDTTDQATEKSIQDANNTSIDIQQSASNTDSTASNPQTQSQSANQNPYYAQGQSRYAIPTAPIVPSYMMEYYAPPFGASTPYVPQPTMLPMMDSNRPQIPLQGTPVVYPPGATNYYPHPAAPVMYPHPPAFMPANSWKWNKGGPGYHYEDGSHSGRYPYHGGPRFFGPRGSYRQRWRHHDDRRETLEAGIDSSTQPNQTIPAREEQDAIQSSTSKITRASPDITTTNSVITSETNTIDSRRQESKKGHPRKKQPQPQQPKPTRPTRRNSQPQFTPDSFPALSNSSPIPATTTPPRVPEGGKAYSAVAASKTEKSHSPNIDTSPKHKITSPRSSELTLAMDLLKPSATQEAQVACLAQDVEALQLSPAITHSPSSYAEILRKNKSKPTNTS